LNNSGGRKDIPFDWLETYLFSPSTAKDMISKPWSDRGRKLNPIFLNLISLYPHHSFCARLTLCPWKRQ